MENGYLEIGKVADYQGLPVTLLAGNVIYNGIHWHDHLEILLCKKGGLDVRIEGERNRLEENEYILINSNESHEIIGGQSGKLQIICSIDKALFCRKDEFQIVLDGTEDKKRMRMLLGELAVLYYHDYMYEAGKTLTGARTGCNYSGSCRECTGLPGTQEQGRLFSVPRDYFKYQMLVYELLYLLDPYVLPDGEPRRGRKAKTSSEIKECISYINRHACEEINASVLAERLHVSEPTIYRLFSQQVGMHLSDYISMVRVQTACRYLDGTDDSITEIAYQCGFSSLSNFYRVFKSVKGTNPKQCRKDKTNAAASGFRHAEEGIMGLNQFEPLPLSGSSVDDLR